jgi:uncharacterized protein (TIGR00251 family)
VSKPVRITVKVKPRASRTRVLRVDGLSIEASLAAPPVDGAANQELLRLLSDVLAVSKSSLRIVLGEAGRSKVVEATGLDVSDVLRLLMRTRH